MDGVLKKVVQGRRARGVGLGLVFQRLPMNAIKHETEEFVLAGKVCYLYTPVSFGISKLGERYERLLGVAATARNWNTVTKMIEMANETNATD